MNRDKQNLIQGYIPNETLVHFFQQTTNQNEILDFISHSLSHNIEPNISKEEKIFGNRQLIHSFLHSSMEKNLKKGALKCIMNLSQEWHSQILAEIFSYFDEMSLKVLTNYDDIPIFFENIIVLLTDFMTANEIFNVKFPRIAHLYDSLTKTLHEELKNETIKMKEIKLVQLVHFVIQTLIVFVDESCKRKTSIIFPRSLYESVEDIMTCRKLCINTTNNCGLLLVTLDCNFFDISSSIKKLKLSSQSSPIECLAMCHGLLINSSLLDSTINNSFLVLILDAVRTIYVHNMNDSLVIMEILKIILLIAKRIELKKYNLSQSDVKYLVDLLLSHLDHFLNSIKNLCKEALKQFILQKDESIIFEVLAFLKCTQRVDRKTCIILATLSAVIPFSQLLASYHSLINDLRHASKNSVSSNYVCQAYLSLMISSYDDSLIDDWYNLWMEPLLCESDDYNLLLEQILVPVVKLSPFIAQRMITFCRRVNETNYTVVVKCLLEIKPVNLLSNIELSNFSDMNLNSIPYWKNLLPLELMKRMICVPNSVTALKTANLIIETWKGKEILSPEEICLLKLFINFQMAPKQSDFRHKFLNLLKQLFIKISKNDNSDCSDFVEWTTSICISNLFPGASYERRYNVLRILQIIMEANIWPSSKTDLHCLKVLIKCINDPFDENKEVAKNIIISKFIQKKELNIDTLWSESYSELFPMISGMRFLEHETAAHLLEILCSVDFSTAYFTKIAIAMDVPDIVYKYTDSTNLRVEGSYLFFLNILSSSLKRRLDGLQEEFVVKYPLHGFLRIIRHLLKCILSIKNQKEINTKRWKILLNEIVHISISCNEFSVGIVSHSSPEGYLPSNECKGGEEETYCAAQQLLLCNWRTIKEASLILGDLVENCYFDIDGDDKTCLNKSIFLDIGNHLRTLIYKIRHKGSFKQVYIALLMFCKRCWSELDPDISNLPKQWLAEIANEIINNDRQLCVTRRGAGVPCIVLAILCTEPNDNRKYASNLLKKFMEEMFKVLNEEDVAVESKVHAMNILCELFKHKDMSDEINMFIERAVIISINGFKSLNWSERNTSNLLLSSILIRIFGVPRSRNEISWKNKMTGKMFFQKYPSLYDVFLFHLQQNKDESVGIQSALYPILLIFARLYPSHHDDWNITFQLNAFIPFIYNCCQSSVFKIRQLAVQAIIPLISPDIYVEHMNKIWFHLLLSLPENTKHGLLLQFDGLLQNGFELGENINESMLVIYIRILLEAEVFFRDNHSFVVREKLLTILSIILRKYYSRIHLQKINNYPINENYFFKHSDDANEQNYVKTVRTFNVGLRYIKSVKNHTVSEFVQQLESMIEKRSIEVTTNIVLEFIVKTISNKKLDNENVVLQHLIPDGEINETFKRICLKSFIIQKYIFSQLVSSTKSCLYETIIILPDFLRNSSEKEFVIETFLIFCEQHHNNSKLMTPFLVAVDILLEKLDDCWEEKCLSLLKFILTTIRKPCSEYQRSLKRFCFKYFNHSSLKVDEELVLNIWTYVIEKIPDIDEDEFIYFVGLLKDFHAEEHLLRKKILQLFDDYLKSNSLLYAVALFSWIIKDIGVITDEDEKNDIFFGDLPDYFEDHLLICKLCTESFGRLLKHHPSVLHDKLSTTQISWLLCQSALTQERFDVFTLFDIISIILLKFEKFNLHSSNSTFSSRETVEQQVILCKLSFLYSLIPDHENAYSKINKMNNID